LNAKNLPPITVQKIRRESIASFRRFNRSFTASNKGLSINGRLVLKNFSLKRQKSDLEDEVFETSH